VSDSEKSATIYDDVLILKKVYCEKAWRLFLESSSEWTTKKR